MSKNQADMKEQFKQHPNDTGSVEVQIVSLTEEIIKLTEHSKVNPKDHSSRYGLLKMVGKRRKFLTYLKRTNEDVYNKLIKSLETK
jgi:small subunit ribosomal protein S15